VCFLVTEQSEKQNNGMTQLANLPCLCFFNSKVQVNIGFGKDVVACGDTLLLISK
jgi:hypothetical protein